jgi:hypothetical protein
MAAMVSLKLLAILEAISLGSHRPQPMPGYVRRAHPMVDI